MDVRTIQTPVGLLRLTATETALTAVHLNARGVPDRARARGVLAETEQQLAAYFAGTLTTFDLPIALTGTPFQCEVWTMLRYIPFGETCSYAELADRIGRPKAVRAVGAANGQNPIPIIIPCHRVIGTNGSLTGFGGGLKMKAWLLAHEGHTDGQPRLDF
jgi:methylated-DNA-[protein]-cysteine S-methyltransferase